MKKQFILFAILTIFSMNLFNASYADGYGESEDSGVIDWDAEEGDQDPDGGGCGECQKDRRKDVVACNAQVFRYDSQGRRIFVEIRRNGGSRIACVKSKGNDCKSSDITLCPEIIIN